MSDDTADHDAPPAKKQRYVRLNLSQSNIKRRVQNFKQNNHNSLSRVFRGHLSLFVNLQGNNDK